MFLCECRVSKDCKTTFDWDLIELFFMHMQCRTCFYKNVPKPWSKKTFLSRSLHPRRSSHPGYHLPSMSVASTSTSSGLRSPWAEQFGGCGLEARTVHVPGGMFLSRHREKEKSEFFLKKIEFCQGKWRDFDNFRFSKEFGLTWWLRDVFSLPFLFSPAKYAKCESRFGIDKLSVGMSDRFKNLNGGCCLGKRKDVVLPFVVLSLWREMGSCCCCGFFVIFPCCSKGTWFEFSRDFGQILEFF